MLRHALHLLLTNLHLSYFDVIPSNDNTRTCAEWTAARSAIYYDFAHDIGDSSGTLLFLRVLISVNRGPHCSPHASGADGKTYHLRVSQLLRHRLGKVDQGGLARRVY